MKQTEIAIKLITAGADVQPASKVQYMNVLVIILVFLIFLIIIYGFF